MTIAALKPRDHADWKAGLICSRTGIPKPLLANAITALRYSPEWAMTIAFDEFAMTTRADAAPPWEMAPGEWAPRPWTPHDDLLTTEWLQHQGIEVTLGIAQQAIETVGRDRACNPLLDYLDALEWDGQPRLTSWMANYLGAPDTPYTNNVSRQALIAAVARVRNPGCKVDTVPIIEGPQGIGKSSALRELFAPWFSDELAELGSKDAAMQTRGAWLIEISELDAMSRAEVSRIKAFITRTTDRFRPPYGSRVIESPRSCVFWGTTNSDAYLKDESGGRRFWPIRASKIDLTGLRGVKDQLWAEAQTLFANGCAWWLVNPDVQRDAREEQRARYIGDPWESAISDYLKEVSDVSVEEVLALAIHLERTRWTQVEMNRVARCLRSLGWLRFQTRSGDKRVWRYRNGA